MMAESKSYSAGTKRRRYLVESSAAPKSRAAALSRRITRLQKAVKVHNPTHLIYSSLSAVFGSISTTGTLYEPLAPIAQGDDYNNRFSSKTKLSRLNLRGVFFPGSTAAAPCLIRVTVIRAASGLAFAANTNASYNPIVTGTSLFQYYDKFYAVAATQATQGYGTPLNMSLKIGHVQKYSGTGAGATTGESVYIIVQSNVVAGTGAPVVIGVLETFFDPM